MSGDTNPSRSGNTGFGDVTGESTYEERSSGAVLADTLRGRWQMLLVIAALTLTTVGLWYMDGALTKDVWVFGILDAFLIVYFLLTLRTDLRLE